MHQVTYGGWLLYLLWTVALASAAGALFVVVDALRRPSERFASAAWRLVWAVPQAVYLAILALALIPSLSQRLAGAVTVLILPASIAQIAYLLRVVWPTPRRLAEMESAAGVGASVDPPPLDDDGDAGEPWGGHVADAGSRSCNDRQRERP